MQLSIYLSSNEISSTHNFNVKRRQRWLKGKAFKQIDSRIDKKLVQLFWKFTRKSLLHILTQIAFNSESRQKTMRKTSTLETIFPSITRWVKSIKLNSFNETLFPPQVWIRSPPVPNNDKIITNFQTIIHLETFEFLLSAAAHTCHSISLIAILYVLQTVWEFGQKAPSSGKLYDRRSLHHFKR